MTQATNASTFNFSERGKSMKTYYGATFSREQFDNLALEMCYRYNVPELEILDFYGIKRVNQFKQSHKPLFAELFATR